MGGGHGAGVEDAHLPAVALVAGIPSPMTCLFDHALPPMPGKDSGGNDGKVW